MCVARDGGWQCCESEQPLEETAVIEPVSPGGAVAGMDSDL